MPNQIIIIGGGIAGLAMMIGLKKAAIPAQLFERSAELKGIGAGFGLAANAMQALSLLGIKDDVIKIGHFLSSYNILNKEGKILTQPDTRKMASSYQEDNFAIHRADLHQYLLSQIDEKDIFLDKKAIRFQHHTTFTTLFFEDGTTVNADYVIISDGVHSGLRQQLIPSSGPRYSGYTCWRATVSNNNIQLKSSFEVWGKEGRFGVTPLVKNRIYWYACVNAPRNSEKHQNWKSADLLEHFKGYDPKIIEILKETPDESILWNDIIDIKPLKQLAFGNMVLIGDAGHATTPNMGQGACQAVEDVVVLLDEIQRHPKDWSLAFQHFEKRRINRVHYITKISWHIGKVAQWQHPLAIRIRDFLMQLLPEKVKQYSLKKLLTQNFMTLNSEHEK